MDAVYLKKVVIADDADLILVCDDVALHVSSQVLRSASPVFEAMLGPNFSEGQALLNAERGDAVMLFLPDDDAVGFESLCYALHHQNWRQTSDDTIDSIVRFALTVNKYHCSSAVEGILIPLIYNLDPSPHEIGDLTEGIFLLDDPKVFRMYTSSLIEKALCQRERDGVKFLSQEIDRVVDCILPAFIRSHGVDLGGSSTEEEDGQSCDYDQRAAGRYLEVFMAFGLWPSSKRERTSLRSVVEKIRDMEIPKLDKIQGCGLQWDDDGKRFREIVNPKIGMLKQLAKDLRVGLCLDCFKAGGKPHGPCRVPHDELTSEHTRDLESLHDMDMQSNGDNE